MRVLVIDDDPSIREVIRFALEDEGYAVDDVADGAAALRAIARRHPDLILLDMRMPGMDGWDFVGHYREHYGHQAPILVLTAAQDAAQRGTAVHADGYVAKPFDLEELLARVAQMLGQPSGQAHA